MMLSRAPRGQRRRNARCSTLRTLLPLLAIVLRTTDAQAKPPIVPTSVQEMAHMRAGSHLYVQGGKVIRNNVDFLITPQLFSLDLSTSWTTDSPPWKSHMEGSTYSLFNGVASPDNRILTTVYQSQSAQLLVNQYSVESDTWTNNVISTNEKLKGIRPVMDLTSGLVYIAGWSNMIVLDPKTMESKFIPIANTTMVSRLFGGAVYHPGRKSILYLGGFALSGLFEATTYVTEYTVATNTWSTFLTEGVLPTVRADHCMAINEDGSKIVVFGGRTPTAGSTSETTFTGTLYILDVATATWRPGLSSTPRLYMACTIVGDQFIAWGGYDGMNTIDGPPIIYSLSTNTWISSYTAPAYLTNSSSPSSGITGNTSPSSPKSPSSSSPNQDAILGGTLGSLSLLAFAGVVYLLLKRKTDRMRYKALAQQLERKRTSSQTEISNNPTTPMDEIILTLPLSPTPSKSSTSATTVNVSKIPSQHNLNLNPKPNLAATTLHTIRNPQDEGSRDHTIDYDPIGFAEVNPHHVINSHHVFQSNLRGLYIVPQMSSAGTGYHYLAPMQNPRVAPHYVQSEMPTFANQPVNFGPTFPPNQQQR